jgi:lysophospholipase L1-like esterase
MKNYVLTSAPQFFELPNLSENGTILFPDASNYSEQEITIWNQNNNSFSLTFAGIPPLGPNGIGISSIPNRTVAVYKSDGARWVNVSLNQSAGNIGTIFFERQFEGDSNAFNDFTDSDSGITYNDGHWITSGGVGNQFKYLKLDTLLSATDVFKVTLRFKKLANEPSSDGVGIGIISLPVERSWYAQASFANLPQFNYSPGQAILYSADTTNGSLIDHGRSPAISVNAAGDVYSLTLQLDRSIWTTQIINESLTAINPPLIYNAPLTFPFYQHALPYLHNFAINNFGGSYEILSLKIEVDLPKPLDLVLLGDSIFAGYYAEAPENTIYNLLTAENSTLRLGYLGGGGSTVSRLRATVNETKSYLNETSTVVIHSGGNDLFAGVTPANILQEMIELVNDLLTTGADVYVAGPAPISFTVNNQVPALHQLFSDTFSNKYIDVFTPLSIATGDINPVYYTAQGQTAPWDGVHPSPAGHALIANTIKNKLTSLFTI